MKDTITLVHLLFVHNSIQISNDLTKLNVNNVSKLITLDVKDIYKHTSH